MSEYLNVEELRVSADHNLTDSRTKAQLHWAANLIEELEGFVQWFADQCGLGNDGSAIYFGWLSADSIHPVGRAALELHQDATT